MTKTLILMGCSGAKLDHAAPARDLYLGVMWQSLRANVPEGNLPHIVVLSSLYGFVSGETVIEPYEKLLTVPRSRELEYNLGQYVTSVDWPKDVRRILVAGGGLYRYLMRRMIGELISTGTLARNLEISEVSGGIGVQRSQIGQFVRDQSSLPVAYVGYHPNGTPLLPQAWGLAVGDRVRTTGSLVGKSGPRFARVEELFMGPSGPTACVEYEDDRPQLASGKPRAALQCRGAWASVRFLERVAPAEDLDPLQSDVDLDAVWQPIPGLRTLAGQDEGDAPLMGSLLTVERDEPEAERPRLQ